MSQKIYLKYILLPPPPPPPLQNTVLRGIKGYTVFSMSFILSKFLLYNFDSFFVQIYTTP